ncbi:ChaN family lipoprotein [Nitrincola sp.]|uniref:ChaN family lipoprotein n=1 Tax=Nitrincola sp. TaxID=1926584 RepID=UPI003A919361
MRSPLLIQLLGLALLLSTAVQADSRWLAPHQADHPLVGKLWHSEQQSYVGLDVLLDSLPQGSWLMLGEQHDHPDHHQLQLQILTQLAKHNRLGSVAFEMANSDQQPLIDEWSGRGDSATAEALNWSAGWPWERYAPQLQFALNQAEQVVAADLPRTAQMQAYQQGAAEGYLDTAHTRYMMELIYTSHCQQLPRTNLIQMLQVQLARDQQMARRMQATTQTDKINVLIAGAQHTRKDTGVARWLPDTLQSTSLIMVPLSEQVDPAYYLEDTYPGYTAGEISTDLLLFTPAMPEQDHCAAFQ